jgi:hypothetical protein
MGGHNTTNEEEKLVTELKKERGRKISPAVCDHRGYVGE